MRNRRAVIAWQKIAREAWDRGIASDYVYAHARWCMGIKDSDYVY